MAKGIEFKNYILIKLKTHSVCVDERNVRFILLWNAVLEGSPKHTKKVLLRIQRTKHKKKLFLRIFY